MIIPLACPVQFIPINPVRIPQYISKFMDSYWSRERRTRWQEGSTIYAQPWLRDDSILMQFITDLGASQIDLIDCKLQTYATLLTTQVRQNTYEPSTFIYEASMALNVIPEDGIYYLKKVLTNGQTWISEPLDIQTEHDPSLLIEFFNTKYYGNMIFETGYRPSMRIAALLRLKPPVSKDTIYEDQVLDMTMIQSKPYRIWEFVVFGKDSGGVPDWMIDKLMWQLGCDNLRIDGRYFTKSDGFKWEEKDVFWNGATIGYSCELREMLNRGAKIYEPGSLDSPSPGGGGFGSGSTGSNDISGARTTLILNVESKGFADTGEDASSNLVTVIDVE